MPKGIGKFFPGISGLSISQSKLKVIDKDDLQPFDRLVVLYLGNNDLESLSSDLFDYNPLLRDLFVYNKLKSIGSNIFNQWLRTISKLDSGIHREVRQQCPDSAAAPNLLGEQ